MLSCFGISAMAADEAAPAPTEDTASANTAPVTERTLSKVQLEDLGALIAAAKADERIAAAIEGKTVIKEIAVPNKIVNIVVK